MSTLNSGSVQTVWSARDNLHIFSTLPGGTVPPRPNGRNGPFTGDSVFPIGTGPSSSHGRS